MNPGSTSTKIAVYEDETPVFVESIEHSQDELKPFETIIDQYEMRKELILATMEKNGVKKEDLTAIVSRGGLLPPIEAGAYEVNDDMVWQLTYAPQNEHASNLGAVIARSISKELHDIPAYIYEMCIRDRIYAYIEEYRQSNGVLESCKCIRNIKNVFFKTADNAMLMNKNESMNGMDQILHALFAMPREKGGSGGQYHSCLLYTSGGRRADRGRV